MKKQRPIIFVIVFLLFATLACSLGGKQSTESDEEQGSSLIEIVTSLLGGKQSVKLGETFRSEVGGFSLQKVVDYEFNEIFGMVIMMPADASDDVGPFIMAYGELTDKNVNAQGVWDDMQGETDDDISFSKPKKVKVDGVEGLLIEFSGEEDGTPLRGKVFVAAPFPNQSFQLTALAPKARWKELEPIFDAVLKSVHFFEGKPFDFGLDDLEFDENWDYEDWDWDDEDWNDLWDDERLEDLFDGLLDELDLDLDLDLEGLLEGILNQGKDH